MTDTDNKDPQITPEVVQEWLYGVLHEHKVVSNITDIQLARAFLHQAAELQQLRAERAGLIEMISNQIQAYNIAIEKQPEKKEVLRARQSVYRLIYNHIFQQIKSKLTRTEQTTEENKI